MSATFIEPGETEPKVEIAEPNCGAWRWAGARCCLVILIVVATIVVLARHVGLKVNLNNENLNVAWALRADRGFADPFQGRTGPTAWVPPILPGLLAAVLDAGDGRQDVVTTTIIVLQYLALAGTLLLVLLLARQSTWRCGPEAIAAAFLLIVLAHFRTCFLTASLDGGLNLITLNLVLAGLCCARPLADGKRAAAWGVFGGIAALVNPVAGFVWGGMSLVLAMRERAWSRLALTVLFAALALTPWTIRNYWLFGRLIPVKSNLYFEFFQTQSLQETGVHHPHDKHPFRGGNSEGHEFQMLGETAYLDRKREQFLEAVKDHPEEFFRRVLHRFWVATLVYEPFNQEESRHPWTVRLTPIVHALPFLALLFLLTQSVLNGLPWERWAVIGMYVLYLLPYVVVIYYDRYVMPLVGVKVLLVVWAMDEFVDICVRRLSRLRQDGYRAEG